MNLTDINLTLIDNIFEFSTRERAALIDEILSYNSEMVDIHAEDERAFPGNKRFLDSGWYKTMLKRYFFAGNYLCKNKTVLDTCCGLGWGTYIVSHYANNMTAFDLNEEVIKFCRNTWKAANVNWMTGNALDLSFLGQKEFDVALAMETIEHFTKEDGERHISEISSRLKENGLLVGTSCFTNTRKIADEECKRNKYHKYIFTLEEIKSILGKHFREYVVVSSWMFVAKK